MCIRDRLKVIHVRVLFSGGIKKLVGYNEDLDLGLLRGNT